MTVLEVSILSIAAINVVLMAAITFLLMRLIRVMKSAEDVVQQHGVPLMGKLNQVADNVKNISQDVRLVEQRVAAVTTRVVDQVEPPVRQFAALVAGVRAGVGRLFDGNQRDQQHDMAHQSR